MARSSNPTVRNRELGALLRGYREAKNLTAAQVATDVGIAAAVLSRLENATRAPRQANVRALCSYYGLDAATTERLVRMAREAAERGWWQRYNLEPTTATYLSLESAAAAIEMFDSIVIPGLLQTEGYAKAVIGPVRLDFSPEQLAETVESRTRRQQLLTGGSGVDFHAVIDEAVLRRLVGSREVMLDQLKHLRSLAELPKVTIQVLPFDAGANGGLDGTFTILYFSENLMPTVVYVEAQLGQLFEDEPGVIRRVRQSFTALAESALDTERSMEMIDARIRELSS